MKVEIKQFLNAIPSNRTAVEIQKAFDQFLPSDLDTAITAKAGGVQATATPLKSRAAFHDVTTVASAADAIVLPAAKVGEFHFVKNSATTNAMQVFAPTPDTIDSVATATGVSQLAGDAVLYVCLVGGNYIRLGGVSATEVFTTITATTGNITTLNAGAIVQAPVFVADATPYAVLAADSGKLHIILEQTNSITLNLPVIAAGLSYKFIMGGVATEAQDWVIVATTPSFYNGGVSWDDSNAVASPVPVYGNGTSHLTLTVTTPEAGTAIEIYSNGTEWFVCGAVFSAATPAFT